MPTRIAQLALGLLVVTLSQVAFAQIAMAQVYLPDSLVVCGTQSSDSLRLETTGQCDVRARIVFCTTIDQVQAEGDSLLPVWADSMVRAFSSYIDSLDFDRHSLTLDIVKRAGADSLYYWVAPFSSQDPGGSAQNYIEFLMLPTGWDDGVTLKIFIVTSPPPGNSPGGQATGWVCSSGSPQIVIYSGRMVEDQWLRVTRPALQWMLAHEYGHELGAVHEDNTASGEVVACDGDQYYACYDIMSRSACGGCPEALRSDVLGLVPYHPWQLEKFGWLDIDSVQTSTVDYVLPDIRRTGRALCIPVDDGSESGQYFLVSNHQRHGLDHFYEGRGLLIWHVKPIPSGATCYFGGDGRNEIVDLEHPGGMWATADPESFCRAFPKIVNTVSGVDTMDCAPSMMPSSFWSGLVTGVGVPPDAFTQRSNPSSRMYPSDVSQSNYRRNPQEDDSGVRITQIRAVSDPGHPGEYLMHFNIQIVDP